MNKYLKLTKINNLFFVLIALSTIVFTNCNETPKKYTLDGMTQGSYYHIVYLATDKQNETVKEDINRLFSQIDNSLSLWNEKSLINKINNNQNPNLDSLFIDCFNWSQKISQFSGGYLDCTVGLLVEKYGFAKKEKQNISQETIDSLLQFVGYKNVRIENNKILKTYPQTKIDLNAIAQGYTTDKISWLLKSKGINNFIVDVGGEVRASGKKEKGENWLCGIEQPAKDSDSERSYKTYLELQDQSIVTSGSYRKYYTDSLGNRRSHAIDPFTGKSVEHNLLSVSVVDSSATFCDGLATAFLVMGLDKSKEFLSKHPNLKAHFIYFEDNQYKTYTTPNLKLRDIE
ncbi:MAG TPA: FAD:protein FMN transferase [Bacteroidales bacterium]|nr:FAD:protein FMN transferase [Bacteroidales bacterium]